MEYDDLLIKQIDKEMGWDDPAEDAPSAVAARLGYHVKFLSAPFFGASAWTGPNRVWSITILNERGIQVTLLAKTFEAVKKLYSKLCQRAEEEKPQYWTLYYRAMWNRRYRKWVCKKPNQCFCQLCQVELSQLKSSFVTK